MYADAPELIVCSAKDGETTFAFGHGEAILSNRVQLRWRERRREGLDRERLLNIPRARTEVTGWVVSEHFRYEVQVDWAERAVEDLFISWDASRNGTFTLQKGQFKVPLGRQRLTSSGSQQFVDRSDVIDEFTPGRDVGVQVQTCSPAMVSSIAPVSSTAPAGTPGRIRAGSSTPAV